MKGHHNESKTTSHKVEQDICNTSINEKPSSGTYKYLLRTGIFVIPSAADMTKENSRKIHTI